MKKTRKHCTAARRELSSLRAITREQERTFPDRDGSC
jgi:hypothetical protein